MAEGRSRIERLQERVDRERERYPQRSVVFRVAWVTAAIIIVLAGAAMVVFPGPAILVIPVGLAMLSLQFAWAQRVLDKGLEGGKAAQELASNATPRQKVLAAAGAVCAGAGVVAIAWTIVN